MALHHSHESRRSSRFRFLRASSTSRSCKSENGSNIVRTGRVHTTAREEFCWGLCKDYGPIGIPRRDEGRQVSCA